MTLIEMKKTPLSEIHLECTDMDQRIDYDADDYFKEQTFRGSVNKRNLKRFYDLNDWGYWRIPNNECTDIIDGSTKFEDFILCQDELNDLVLNYLRAKGEI